MRDSPPDGQPGAASSSARVSVVRPLLDTVRLSPCWARRRAEELGGRGQVPCTCSSVLSPVKWEFSEQSSWAPRE